MSKNWSIDPKINCKFGPSNLVKLIEICADLKEELKKFEGTFKRDEVVNLDEKHCFKLFL